MRITIQNEQYSSALHVKHSDSIASVKAKYVASGKCLGRKDFIVFLYHGKELEDEASLGEQGVADQAVLVHMEAIHDPYRGVDYATLARNIEKRREHNQNNLRMMQQDNIWAPDASGTVRNLGFDKSLVSTRSPLNSSSSFFPASQPPSSAKSDVKGRAFFNQLSVLINGSSFHILPRMEGRWNGETASVVTESSGTNVCSSEILFREEEGVWSQLQMSTTIVGITTTSHYWLKPVADGILKAETDDPTLRGCDITLREIGTNIILMTAVSKRTGKTILVETTTLIDSSRRLRTVQTFHESGAIRTVLVMNEKRVVDAVSGAMEKYGSAPSASQQTYTDV